MYFRTRIAAFQWCFRGAVYIDLDPFTSDGFLPTGNDVKVHVWFSCKVETSSSIAFLPIWIKDSLSISVRFFGGCDVSKICTICRRKSWIRKKMMHRIPGSICPVLGSGRMIWLGIPLRSLEVRKVGLMCDWIVEQEGRLEKVQ